MLWVRGSLVAPPVCRLFLLTGQVGLEVGSWPSNRATEGSLNADTNDGFPSTVGGAGHVGFVGIVPWSLTSRW